MLKMLCVLLKNKIQTQSTKFLLLICQKEWRNRMAYKRYGLTGMYEREINIPNQISKSSVVKQGFTPSKNFQQKIIVKYYLDRFKHRYGIVYKHISVESSSSERRRYRFFWKTSVLSQIDKVYIGYNIVNVVKFALFFK